MISPLFESLELDRTSKCFHSSSVINIIILGDKLKIKGVKIMEQELIEKIQYILTQEFSNTNIYNFDLSSYYVLITKVLTSINIVLVTCGLNLNENTIFHKLESDYILITSKASLKILDGQLAVILNIKDFFINAVETSIIH